MEEFLISFSEPELIRCSIYSRLEYLHATINKAMSLSSLKLLLLDEATALIEYCSLKQYYLPPHIIKEHEADMKIFYHKA